MANRNLGRIAKGLIWLGLALVVWGGVTALTVIRDTLQAQSAPATLSFVITVEPSLAGPATSADTGPRTPIASPAAGSMMLQATSAAPAAPLFLPDDSTPDAPASTKEPTALPTATVAGQPPDRIVIRSIELDAPVKVVGWHVEQMGDGQVSVWDVPEERAAGWLKTSAPAGQKGNTVLDGHHNINGQVFRHLVDLKPRDMIELYVGDQVWKYAVTEKHILPDRDQPLQVRIANAQWIQATDDERLTLVTCWPFTSNTHRLIIVARPLARMPNLSGGKIVQ